MMNFKKILLPIDINDANSWKKPLPLCISMLEKNPEAQLWLLAVVPNFGLGVVEEYFPAGWTKEIAEKTFEALEKIAKTNIPSNFTPNLIVDKGAVYQILLDQSNRLGIDLIVMSAIHPNRKDYLLGPNVARVARHSEVSVLIVR
jgi:universal stress protein F